MAGVVLAVMWRVQYMVSDDGSLENAEYRDITDLSGYGKHEVIRKIKDADNLYFVDVWDRGQITVKHRGKSKDPPQ